VSGCAADSVIIGGVSPPALADYGKLARVVGQIVRIRPPHPPDHLARSVGTSNDIGGPLMLL